MPNSVVVPSTSTGLDGLATSFSTVRLQSAVLLEAVAARHFVTAKDLRAMAFIRADVRTTPKALSDHLAITAGSMTALIDRLEACGMVTRSAHPTDRRSILVSLTPHGEQAVAEATDAFDRALTAAVPADQIAQLTDAFFAIANELRSASDAATIPLTTEN